MVKYDLGDVQGPSSHGSEVSLFLWRDLEVFIPSRSPTQSSHTRVLCGMEMDKLLTSSEMEVSSVPSIRHKRRPGPPEVLKLSLN